MSRAEVYSALSASGVPVAHMCFPEGSAPVLPYMVFYSESDNVFAADCTRYSTLTPWTVELYEKFADETTEGLVENAILTIADLISETYEEYVDEERCLVKVYRFHQTKKGQ